MSIRAIHSFLVHPFKDDPNAATAIGGTRVPVTNGGRLLSMLTGVYESAEKECKIDIAFSHAEDGSQQNDCRDLLVAYAHNGLLDDGREIARRLQSFTNKNLDLGYCF